MEKRYDEVLNLVRVNPSLVSSHVDYLITKAILHVCPSSMITAIVYTDGEPLDSDGNEVFGASHRESGVIVINVRKHGRRLLALIKNKPHYYTSLVVHLVVDLVDTALHEAGHVMGLNEDETVDQAKELSWSLAKTLDYQVKSFGPLLDGIISTLRREWEVAIEANTEQEYERVQYHMYSNRLAFYNPEDGVEVQGVRDAINYHIDPENPWEDDELQIYNSVSAERRVDDVEPELNPEPEVQEEPMYEDALANEHLWSNNIGEASSMMEFAGLHKEPEQSQPEPEPEQPVEEQRPFAPLDDDEIAIEEADGNDVYGDDDGWNPLDDESYAVTGNPDDPPTLVTNLGIEPTNTTTAKPELVPPVETVEEIKQPPQGSHLGDYHRTLENILKKIYYHVFTKCEFIGSEADVEYDDNGDPVLPRGNFKNPWGVLDPINLTPEELQLVVACDRYDDNNKWKANQPITDGKLRGTVSWSDKKKGIYQMPQYVLYLNIGGKIYRHMFAFQRPSDGVSGGKWANAAYKGARIGALKSNVDDAGNVISIYCDIGGKLGTDEKYSVWNQGKKK